MHRRVLAAIDEAGASGHVGFALRGILRETWDDQRIAAFLGDMPGAP